MDASYTIRLQDRFSSPLKGLEGKMNHFEGGIKRTQGMVNSFGSSLTSAFVGGVIAGGITQLIGQVRDLAVEIINVTREFTNLKESIEFASGKNAYENIRFLDQEIERLGLDVMSTYKGFKTFTGALMGTSLEGKKGLDIFQAVSEAATVMKLSSEQTEGAFLALGQMISKGNVQAEELRGQLGERLPGAFNIMARALGVSTKELNKMLENGEVLAEQALPLLAAELRRTFSPGVADAMNSFNANMNRFNAFILKTRLELGEKLIPVINSLISIIPKLDFSAITDTFKQMFTAIEEISAALGYLAKQFGISLDGMTAFQAAVQYVAFLFRLAWTPIRGFLEILKLVVTAVTAAVPVFQEFGEAVKNAFTLNFDELKQNARRIKNLAKDFGSTMGAAIETAMTRESEGWANVFKMPTATPGGTNASNTTTAPGGGLNQSTAGAGKNGKGSGVERLASSTRNVTVNITKLIGEVKFEKSSERSEAQLMDMVKRALMTAVNDVNIVAQ